VSDDGPPRTALVTGAAGAVGRAIAATLQQAGWRVGGVDLRPSATDHHVTADVTDGQALTAAHDEIVTSLGAIGLLVTAADDGDGPELISEIAAATWTRTLNVHLRGAQNAVRATLPAMLERGAGNIVTILPADALAGRSSAHRSAAVGATLGMMKALAREVGPRGVLVNAVSPGSLTADDAAGLPLDRALAPNEIADTIVFLAQERHYFAGQLLAPSGGMLL
jgi:NAD(P)-dependent dehydrogenase (short-subunit alcohol dehydrogenase family)